MLEEGGERNYRGLLGVKEKKELILFSQIVQE